MKLQRLKSLAGAATLSGALALSTLAAAPAHAAAPPIRYCPTIITQADSGKTIPLALGSCALLELDGGFIWSPPVVSGSSVTVMPVCTGTPAATVCRPSPLASATQVYEVNAVAPGESTITSVGNLPCFYSTPPCLAPSILFRVTIAVIPPSAA